MHPSRPAAKSRKTHVVISTSRVAGYKNILPLPRILGSPRLEPQVAATGQ
jgi:hypothetical protein